MTHGPGGEVPLRGGNVGAGVVRVGNTVRRPAGPWSPAVDALLRHLTDVGFAGAPRSLGFDERGRHVIEYVDGPVPMPFQPADRVSALLRVGRLLRDFHDASEEFVALPDAEWNVVVAPDRTDLVVHHDPAPWNLVLGADRWVLIDWDNAGPGSRLWDLAYAAHGFVPLAPETPTHEAGWRLAALADGYGLDEQGRLDLAAMLVRRIRSMYELLERGHRAREDPWARLWREGHGAVWRGNADYVQQHLDSLRGALLGDSPTQRSSSR